MIFCTEMSKASREKLTPIDRHQTHSQDSVELGFVRSIVRLIGSTLVPALVLMLQVRMSGEKNENQMFRVRVKRSESKLLVQLTVSENVYDRVHLIRLRCNKYRDHQTRRLGFHRMWRARQLIAGCFVFCPRSMERENREMRCESNSRVALT